MKLWDREVRQPEDQEQLARLLWAGSIFVHPRRKRTRPYAVSPCTCRKLRWH